jgi:hypothetical protein
MSDKRWKAQERRVAAYFKTERTPLSGSNSKQTQSDTLHERLYIECKDRKHHATWSLMDDAADKAKAEGKLPAVVLTEPNRRGFLVVIRSDDFEYMPEPGLEFTADPGVTKIIQQGIIFRFKEGR